MGTRLFKGRDPLLAEILDAMPERVSRYRFDDRVVVYCNAAWAAGHGGTPEGIVGRPLDELLTPPELEGMWTQLAQLSRATPLLTDPSPRQAPEDPSIWIEWVDLVIPKPEGDEVLSIGRDVTARHEAQLQLRESEQRFRLAMVNAPIGMQIVGADGRLLEVNEAYCRFIGRSQTELQGLTWETLTHPDDLAGERRRFGRLFDGQDDSYTIEKRFLHADGSIRWGLNSSVLIRDPDRHPLYVLSQIVDLTDRRLAEEQVEQSARLLGLAGSVARLGGWEWDLSTNELRWSEEIARWLGYPVGGEPTFEELLQLHLPEDRTRLQAAIESCLADHTPWDLELAMRTRGGEEIWGRTVGEPGFDDQGELVRIWGAFQDITDRRRAEQESNWLAEQLTATLDRVDDGFITVDRDWRLSHVSARGAQILARDTDELFGAHLWEEFPQLVGTDVFAAAKRAMTEGVPAEVDRYRDERLHSWFQLAAHPSSRGIVMFFRDITEQVEREDTLRRAVEAEQQAAERLRQLDRAKNAFLSAVSHELRTPLTVVHGMATSLKRLRDELDDEARERIEDALVDHADQLRHLLDELLDVDRLARGTLRTNRLRFDAAQLVSSVVVRAPDSDRIRLESPVSLTSHVDPVQLERILTNLLGNATKYAPAGAITVRLSELSAGGLRLEVRDEGPGVPVEERERIFEPFHRVDETHPQPGTGVGLALVADFADLHGGRVWVEEVEDEPGARFVVELPDGEPDPA